MTDSVEGFEQGGSGSGGLGALPVPRMPLKEPVPAAPGSLGVPVTGVSPVGEGSVGVSSVGASGGVSGAPVTGSGSVVNPVASPLVSVPNSVPSKVAPVPPVPPVPVGGGEPVVAPTVNPIVSKTPSDALSGPSVVSSLGVDPLEIVNHLLARAVNDFASDVHFKADAPAYFRVNGVLHSVGDVLPSSLLKEMIFATMDEEQRLLFGQVKELDYAYFNPLVSNRFRVNAYTAQGQVEAVFRVVKNTVVGAAELGLPKIVDELAKERDGLILVAGATGQGKTTTLASMIDYINSNYLKRIMTIENPVEILHEDKKSVISQREVGGDTESFNKALRSVLRQDPDVILIGEIRDQETAEIALQASITGHLVLATIHASTAEETVQRFAALFEMADRANVKKMFATAFKGVLAQRLILGVDGAKIPALEVMVSTDRIRKAILDDADGTPGAESLSRIIHEGNSFGMITLDQYLIKLILKNRITVEQGLAESVNAAMFKQELQRRGLMSL